MQDAAFQGQTSTSREQKSGSFEEDPASKAGAAHEEAT
jgi:hypothetical protein